jgi:glycosyltransferase involved in cell wall biosynthesis
MKILIYSRAFAPSVGGIETFVMLLARALADREQEAEKVGERPRTVTVVTQTPRRDFDDASLPFRVVRCAKFGALWRLLGGADVIHLAGPALAALALAILRRKPVVIEHHGFQTICPNGQLLYEPTRMPCPGHFMAHRYYECLRCNAPKGKLRSLTMLLLTFARRQLCRLAAVNIAPTRWLKSALGLPRTAVIYHAVERHQDDGATLSRPSYPPTFAFMGRLVSTKGVSVLLEAANQLKKKGWAFQVKVLGDGPERHALEAKVDSLGLRDCVDFRGYVPQSSLEEDLAGVAAVVMPSLAGEVFGLVAAEQMARGRLLIASDVGGLGEVVGDAGLKVAAGDVTALAERMEKVLQAPSLTTELGQRARERALSLFCEQRMVAEHVAAYGRLVSPEAP